MVDLQTTLIWTLKDAESWNSSYTVCALIPKKEGLRKNCDTTYGDKEFRHLGKIPQMGL